MTLALYNPVNRHPFVNYDDDRYVTENPHVRQGLTGDTVAWALSSTGQANWHPLTWISHALDCSLFRLNPAGHHFTSIVFHVLNIILLYLLLIWSTGRIGPSVITAALFALHPIQVESVAWIAERKNVLCTFFFLLALLAYCRYAQKPDWKRYLAVTLAFVAALASKPMVITLPFVLLLLDFWPLNRTHPGAGKESISWTRLVIEKLPWLLLSVISAVITLKAQQAGGAVRSAAEFSFPVRSANAIYAYAMYLWKAIWPVRLAPLYPHPGNSLAAWKVVVAAGILIGVTAAVWRFRTRRYLPVGWFWFLGTLVPVIGIVQVGEAAMADRYAYIPLIGIFVMISFGVADFAESRKLNALAGGCAAVVLVGLACATHNQIGYWQSSVDLWSHTIAVTPANFVAQDNLGGALILEGKEEGAYAHFQAAASINPHDPMSHSNLGTYFQTHGRLQDAVAEYKTALNLTSDAGLLAETYANLGSAERALGQKDEAHKDFEQSLLFNPNQFNAWLGEGLLARDEGKIDEAIVDLSRSLELRPTAQGYFELGQTLEQTGRKLDALNAYEQALKLAPGDPDAQKAADRLR